MYYNVMYDDKAKELGACQLTAIPSTAIIFFRFHCTFCQTGSAVQEIREQVLNTA